MTEIEFHAEKWEAVLRWSTFFDQIGQWKGYLAPVNGQNGERSMMDALWECWLGDATKKQI